MARELKFRAWFEEEKTMKLVHCLDFVGGTSTLAHIYCGSGEETNWTAIMQYTGLKDKNGKEIYEGDIVKDEEGGKHRVLFIAGTFCFIVLEKMAHAPLSQFIPDGYGKVPGQTTLEVIGNPYENPDLVK